MCGHRNTDLAERLRPIRLLAMDVDGVLTDGSVGWACDASGSLSEIKSFNVKDGLGITLALSAGFQVAWVTGRVSPIVQRRAAELGVQDICQWARDKRCVVTDLLRRAGLRPEEALYIGDDLNDLPAFETVGVKVAVADAALQVRERADWVTERAGGRGAVREVIDGVLAAQGLLDEAHRRFLERLRDEQSSPPVPESQTREGEAPAEPGHGTRRHRPSSARTGSPPRGQTGSP